MTLEHHRCQSTQGRHKLSHTVHHLPVFLRYTIAPPPSKTPPVRGYHRTGVRPLVSLPPPPPRALPRSTHRMSLTHLGRWPRLHTLHGYRPHPRAVVAHAAVLHALASKPPTALPRAAPASSAAGRTSTRRRRPRLHSTGRTSGGPPAFAVAGTGPLLPLPAQPYCPSTRRFPPRTGGSGCRVGGSGHTCP